MHASHVVTGAGPIGTPIALQLAEAGTPVRLLTRSGSGPDHPAIERLRVDVRDEAALRTAVTGATAVFHCTHAAYTAAAWREELPAAEQAVLRAAGDAVVVFPESLYSYSRPDWPMTEDGPRDAVGGKRGVRTALLEARARAGATAVSVVAQTSSARTCAPPAPASAWCPRSWPADGSWCSAAPISRTPSPTCPTWRAR